jgi:hypothetical protein
MEDEIRKNLYMEIEGQTYKATKAIYVFDNDDKSILKHYIDNNETLSKDKYKIIDYNGSYKYIFIIYNTYLSTKVADFIKRIGLKTKKINLKKI